MPRICKAIGTEIALVVVSGVEGELRKWRVTATGNRVSFQGDNSVLQLNNGDGCIRKTTELCTLK